MIKCPVQMNDRTSLEEKRAKNRKVGQELIKSYQKLEKVVSTKMLINAMLF